MKMVPYTKGTLRVDRNMDLECRFGQIKTNLKESGKKINFIMESFLMLMVTNMRASGRIIKQMEMDCIFMQTV